VPLDSGETTLATVDIPGHGPVPLPPVCMPYSPEFRPTQGDRGLVTLEKLGRATGGKERVDVANIWQDLPRQVRLLPVARWLVLAAVFCLLLEVFERRTMLVSGLLRRQRKAKPALAPAEPEPAPKRPAAVPVKRPAGVPAPPPAAVKEPVAVKPVPAPPPAPVTATRPADDADMLEALRKARKKARGRTE
jgi:hypothetical protein